MSDYRFEDDWKLLQEQLGTIYKKAEPYIKEYLSPPVEQPEPKVAPPSSNNWLMDLVPYIPEEKSKPQKQDTKAKNKTRLKERSINEIREAYQDPYNPDRGFKGTPPPPVKLSVEELSPAPELPTAPESAVAPAMSYADLVKQVSDDRYNALAAQFDVEGVRDAQMQNFASQYVPEKDSPEFADYQEALVDLRDQGLYNSETGVAPAIPTVSPDEASNIFLNSGTSSLDGLKAMEAALGLRYAGGSYYLNAGGSPLKVSSEGARALKRGEIDAQTLIDNPMYGNLLQQTQSTTPSRAQQPNFSQLEQYKPQSQQNMGPDVFNKPAEDFNRAHQTPAETNFAELREKLLGMGSEFQPYFSDFEDPYSSTNDYPYYPYMR